MLDKEKNSSTDSRHCCLEVMISRNIKKYQDNGHSVLYTYAIMAQGADVEEATEKLQQTTGLNNGSLNLMKTSRST